LVLLIARLPLLILPLRREAENREESSVGRKRREVTIETERILVISRRHSRPILWCDGCAKEVSMLTVDEAAMMTRSTSRMIFKLVEAGRLHFTETPEGKLLICFNSLA
jgi:hypothetical protein